MNHVHGTPTQTLWHYNIFFWNTEDPNNTILKRIIKCQQGVCIESVHFRYNSSKEDNFGQATVFWNTLTAEQKKNLEQNIAENLKGAAPFLQVSETTPWHKTYNALIHDQYFGEFNTLTLCVVHQLERNSSYIRCFQDFRQEKLTRPSTCRETVTSDILLYYSL
jgi:hypothetical protein